MEVLNEYVLQRKKLLDEIKMRSTITALILLNLVDLYTSQIPKSSRMNTNSYEFPISRFFNATSVVFRNYLCHIEEPISDHEPCCDCDDDCWKYGTCCIDKLWSMQEPKELKKYLELYESKAKQFKQASCETILPREFTTGIRRHEVESLYMISNCPSTADAHQNELCQNASLNGPEGMTPVLGNDTYIYKNKYCAKCNGITDYKHLQYEMKCVHVLEIKNKATYKDLDEFSECIIIPLHTPPMALGIKPCKSQFLPINCSALEMKLCLMYKAETNENFKNVHCLKCSTSVEVDAKTALRALECPKNYDKLSNNQAKNNLKYTHQFTLSFNKQKHVFEVTNYRRKFPILDFFELPNQLYSLFENIRLENYLCSGGGQCCECGTTCMVTRKCCMDNFWNETNPVSIETYKEILLKETDKVKKRSCLEILPNSRFYSERFEMIKWCPRNADKKVIDICLQTSYSYTHPSTNIPVRGSDGELYANSFCARCNGNKYYEYMNISLNCEQLQFDRNSTTIKDASDCIFKLEDPKRYFRSCLYDNDAFYQLCEYGKENYDLCDSYLGKVEDYKNFHCRRCHSNSPVTPTMLDDCLIAQPIFPTVTIGYRLTWSLTLSFSGSFSKIDINGRKETQCKENEMFDFNAYRCVEIVCPFSYTAIGLECIEATDESNKFEIKGNVNTTIDLLMVRHPRVYLEIDETKENSTLKFQETFDLSFLTQMNFQVIGTLSNVSYFQSIAFNTTEELNMTLAELKSKATNKLGKLQIGQSIDSYLLSELYGLDLSKIFPENKLCPFPRLLPLSDLEYNSNISKFTYKNESFSPNDVAIWIKIKNFKVSKMVSICTTYHLSESCFRRFIPVSDIILYRNMTIKHMSASSAQTYLPYQYFPSNNGIYVCVKTDGKHGNAISVDLERLLLAEYYISIIATSLSVICYGLIITSCILFKQLRNIPGLNNCFLSVSLFISDFAFLMSSFTKRNNYLCITSAVIMHWGLLSEITWTLIISIDLVLRFGQFSVHYRDDLNNLRSRLLIGFIPSFATVVLALILDSSLLVDIGYGKNGVCWISNLYARITLYIVPFGLILLIALAAVSYSMKKIIESKKITNKVLGKKQISKMQSLKMAMKLAIILGLCELIGIIQIPSKNPNSDMIKFNVAMGFVYSLFRSLRGFFILFFVYVYDGNLLKFARIRFKYVDRAFMYIEHTEHASPQPSLTLTNKIANSEC